MTGHAFCRKTLSRIIPRDPVYFPQSDTDRIRLLTEECRFQLHRYRQVNRDTWSNATFPSGYPVTWRETGCSPVLVVYVELTKGGTAYLQELTGVIAGGIDRHDSRLFAGTSMHTRSDRVVPVRDIRSSGKFNGGLPAFPDIQDMRSRARQ